MMGGPDLTLDRLTRRHGTNTVLNELSLTLPGGRFSVLLGPSGCGKSTTLRLIAGLDEPSAGRVLIGRRDVTGLPPKARGVAMVFQSYALFPHLTAAENIVFGLRARSVPPTERTKRLRWAAELLDIGPLLSRRPAQLSGGQQQRVALGRAIVAEAPVCLMDEPLSNLDAQLRAEMRRELVSLQRRLGLTMLYVTHDQTEAMAMADLVVLLREGMLEQAATPEVIYQRPATCFAASFIGAPPMNLLPLERCEGGYVIAGTNAPVLALPHDVPLLAGLRPEALAYAKGNGRSLSLRLRYCEYLGADTVLSGFIGSGAMPLVARLPGRVAADPGDAIMLEFDPLDLHLFDAVSGVRFAADPILA